jgi:hypothetical protein
VPAAGFLKSVYLRYLAAPKSDRVLYRAVQSRRIARIVEIGIGRGIRARRLIEMALRTSDEVRYTGIDLFEARPAGQRGLTLKEAYTQLRALGAKVQLAPGDPFAALSRVANSLAGTELLVISGDQDAASLARAWFYVPRMLTEKSQVFVEELLPNSSVGLKVLTPVDVAARAGAGETRRKAA